MNGFSSVLNDVEYPGVFSKFPQFVLFSSFLFFSHFKLPTRERDRQTDRQLPLHKDFPNTEGSCAGMCAGVQASSEITALAIAKENKIDAICRACSF